MFVLLNPQMSSSEHQTVLSSWLFSPTTWLAVSCTSNTSHRTDDQGVVLLSTGIMTQKAVTLVPNSATFSATRLLETLIDSHFPSVSSTSL